MKIRWLSKVFVLSLFIAEIVNGSTVFAVEKDNNVSNSIESSLQEKTNNNIIEDTPTIAPVVIGHEDYTEVNISHNTFKLKIIGESLKADYEFVLSDELRIEEITGEVKYNKEKNSLIFPKDEPFNSDISFISDESISSKTYVFDFGFEGAVSTVITKVTINVKENFYSQKNNDKESSSENNTHTQEENSSSLNSSKIENKSEIAIDENEKSTEDFTNAYAAQEPTEIGSLLAAPKSINQDNMEDFPSKFNFTPKIYPGVTQVGYNTVSATQSISEKELTSEEMKAIQQYGGYFVYYKRAGIYKGRYIDIKWNFLQSPNVNPNIRIKIHSTLNSNYPNNKIMSITRMFYNSRVNTNMNFLDSATKQPATISGYISYGNVDNTEYYTFDNSRISNYVYSFYQNNLKYIQTIPDGSGVTTNFGVQGQPQGMTTVVPANTFTIMFEDQQSFPITYGYVSSGVGYAQWLGAIDLNLLRIGYEAPTFYGDEEGTNIEDNTLEYRAIQSNPSRGGGQTQIVLPEDYKINMEIEHYELLNRINPSDITIKNMDTGGNITSQFDITISENGKVTLNLKNIGNTSIQKNNFPSTMEIKFKATTKTGVNLSKAYQNIDGQGYYVFSISGDLTYRQPAVENDITLASNSALAKIKTDDVPMPELQKSYTNITKEDGLNRDERELYIGDILRYDIKYYNPGDTLTNVKLVDELPEQNLFRKIGEYTLTIDGEEIEIPEDFYDEKNNQLQMVFSEIRKDSVVKLSYQLQSTGLAQGNQLVNNVFFITESGNSMETGVSTEQVDIVPILNPESPTEIITPNTGTLGAQLGNLNLVYVPSFDFGEQKITNRDSEYSAKLVEINDGKEVPNFVQIHDTLQDKSGWKLSMTLDEFYNQNQDKLNGAQLTINNSQYNNYEGLNRPFTGELSKEILFMAGGDANLIAASTDNSDLQNSIIAFGNTEEDTAKNSVSLKIPGVTKKVESDYKANLDWQLQNVPE
ncbi:TPA: WxL domain-containing protein [Enterococcus faecalis]|nr:WxL domain-containing protein [Enterococcus faecalis]EGO8011521.1 WxL domain-containing protein [Enterococcus faecalis]EHU8540951.1 WxL domain-containing protein [Enterococcus faecalis]EIB6520051.1 WxL domain-containing protein [Enterococcus faecalis]EJR1606086.1 WxL domain-containing protein [Enterococcus faecalis]